MSDDLTLAIEFTATDKGLSGKINLTKAQLEKLNKTQRDGAGASGKAAAANKQQERSLFALKAAAAAVVTGLAAVSLKTLSVIRDTERMTAQLITMTGSTDAAGAAFDRLNTFAKQTPFTLRQSIDGFVKLKALGLDPSERAMKSYGNTASAMGKDMNQMIEAVADASTFEFEHLKEFGIKSKQQGDQVSFTFRGIETTIQKSSENIQEYLLGIGETHFADAMSNQMDTIDSKFSNLEQTVNDFFRVLGDDNAAMGAFRDSIDWITEAVDNATLALKFFKANLKADDIAENARAIAETVAEIELANRTLAQLQGTEAKGALTGLNIQLGNAQNRLNELGKEYTRLHPAVTKAVANSNKLDKQTKKTTASTGQFNSKLSDTKDKLADMTGPMSEYTDLLAEGERLTTAMRTEQEVMTESFARYAAMLQVGAIDQETYNRAVAKSIDTFNRSSESAKTASKEIEKQSDPFAVAWENAFKRLDDAGADMWQNLFSGAENSLDSIENLLTSWLAEMAHALITKPLMMNIQASVLGTGGTGSAGTTGLLGGQSGFDLPSSGLTNLIPEGFSLSNFGGDMNFVGPMQPTAAPSAMSSGFAGFGAGYMGAQLTGDPVSGALVGAGGTALMGGIGAMGAGGAGFMAGAGGALAAMGPVGWAALALGALAGGGMFGGDSDVTPDLNLRYNTRDNNVLNPQGTTSLRLGEEENGTFDPGLEYSGRFAAFGFGTQHDAFQSEEDATQFVDAIQGRFSSMEEIIFQTFGETVSQEIADAMDSFDSGMIKNEDFAGAGDFSAMFDAVFGRIFQAVGENSSANIARYEQIYLDALAASGNLEIGIGTVASSKGLLDAGSDRSLENIVETLGLFTYAAEDLDTQLTELAAITQLLALESADDYRGFVAEVIELGKTQSMTAARGAELANILGVTNAMMSNITQSTYDYSIAGAKLAETLANGAGGLDALVAKTDFYYQNFFSAEERTADLLTSNLLIIDKFNLANEALGSVTAGSNDSLRAFIDSLDLTTDAGISAYNAALNLAPVFAQTTDAMNAMANSLGSIYSSAEKWQLDTFSDQQKSDYYSQRADEDYLALQSATGAADIQALVNSIVSSGDKMWALLDDAGKSENLDGYLQAALDVEAAAQERMDLSDSALELIDFKPIEIASQNSLDSATAIKIAADAIEKAAATMDKAAAINLQAANTEKRVAVTVDVPEREVGF